MTQTIEQVRMVHADEMSRATYEAALNDLVGQQYSFTLNERDEITEFTGFQSNTTNVPVSRPGETGFLLVTVIDEDGWKELTQLFVPAAAAGHRHWSVLESPHDSQLESVGQLARYHNVHSSAGPRVTASVMTTRMKCRTCHRNRPPACSRSTGRRRVPTGGGLRLVCV